MIKSPLDGFIWILEQRTNELMALEWVSDTEDRLDFDNSDADSAVSYKDLEYSDSENEPKTAAQTMNSDKKDLSVTAVPTSDKMRIVSQEKFYFWKKKTYCSFFWWSILI